MKRLFIAAAILLSVVVLCIVTLNLQTKNIHYLLNMINEMQQSLDNEDLGNCVYVTDSFVEEFDKRTKICPFFMRHSDISKIEETVVTLPVMLKTGETEHYAVELERCRDQLENLSKLETPTPENIL